MLTAVTVLAFIAVGFLAHRAWQCLRIPPQGHAVYWLDGIEGAPLYAPARSRARR
jgi:hypothetical protein